MTTIYELMYMPGQELSEQTFSPMRMKDNSHAAWREFRAMIDFYRHGEHRGRRSGIFSPKFGLKTKVPAGDFVAFCESNATADVCLINPFPQIAYYSYNVWMQGEINHPGLTERAQDLLNECGIRWDLARVPRHDARVLCYSNFWVGNEAFWERYVGAVLNRIALHIESNPHSTAVIAVMGETWHTDAAPFLPFIIERLFSTFLSLEPSIHVAVYPLPDVATYCLTDYERELVTGIAPIIDAADETSHFTPDLVKIQHLLCSLGVRYAREHFASNVHPHTGNTVQT
ncbi:hypothetical protein [Paraburkholderia caffeinilytica]|uniref:hypothetical protein n=1 Tax=Paraburkholderia caffeinilytica TaxID=1761016 RepID=UPI003DA143FD